LNPGLQVMIEDDKVTNTEKEPGEANIDRQIGVEKNILYMYIYT